ncbi:helix-turn-helix domain-containing protein [Oryzibacter oryziterrae]|uniref:helix-turn-helix domain-containing protein n=1 Tax=Oryzibacter oryziterrae TaxID=2766474 RepID=UPI001F3F1498|nr:helix-turn-helix domain-containing protein [Oryzibacter oryziterrae]
MTPFGARLRQLRDQRGMTMKAMAADIGVSPAYLSALEHGRRGRPTWMLLQRIIGCLNIIWDEAEELERLADLSHPRIVIDTEGLDPAATELANILSQRIRDLDAKTIGEILVLLTPRKK